MSDRPASCSVLRLDDRGRNGVGSHVSVYCTGFPPEITSVLNAELLQNVHGGSDKIGLPCM